MHTPGPWKFKQADPHFSQEDNKFDHLVYTEDTKRHIAEVFQYQQEGYLAELEEVQANARLIAKAPVFYDTIHAAIRKLEGPGMPQRVREVVVMLEEVLNES